MPKNKINAGKTSGRRNPEIHPTKLTPQGISFSFKYYQTDNSKFSPQTCSADYWVALVERLKGLSTMTLKEFMTDRGSTLRSHPIKWEETSERSFGLPNEEQLVDTPYQFSISSNARGRVHGFFIDDVFYIVWLDPDHMLYP